MINCQNVDATAMLVGGVKSRMKAKIGIYAHNLQHWLWKRNGNDDLDYT